MVPDVTEKVWAQSMHRHCLRSRRKACLPITPQHGQDIASPAPQRNSLNTVKASASFICMTLSKDSVRALAESKKCCDMAAPNICVCVDILPLAHIMASVLCRLLYLYVDK